MSQATKLEHKARRPSSSLRREWGLFVSIATSLAFVASGWFAPLAADSRAWLALEFIWLFPVILGSALAVVRHADHLAVRLGEPYGTMILTISITFIEVASISAVMLHGDNKPTLPRDTLFAVVMIILNGMVGMSLLLGGWRHREQHYNLQGANTYLGAIIPLVVFSLVMPSFTQTTAGPTLSAAQQLFLIIVAVGLYVAFLAAQTGRHRGYFALADHAGKAEPLSADRGRVMPHVVLIIAYLIPIIFLAEQMATPIDYLLETLHAPPALGGVIMALLVATPEAVGAVRAALANQLQRSVNIFLGSVLSTIGLTIPAMIIVSRMIGRPIILGVEHADLVMLLLTLLVSVVTFASGRTNVIQGVVHLILFAAYLMLVIQN